MESLIHAFGIDLKLITIQIVNFVVLAGALSYFLYKPVLRILNEREEKIKLGLEDAESAAKAKVNAESDRKSVIQAAHLEAEAVNRRAEQSAKDKAAEITAAADKAAADKIRLAEERSSALADEARRQSEAEIAKLAVLAAEKVLKEKA